MSNTVDAISTAPATVESAPARPFPRHTVMHAAVDIASPDEIVEYLTNCMRERRGCSVVGISAPYATAMADDLKLRDAFLKSDLLVPDGKGFTWGARMLNVPCGERLAIPDLCELLLERANQNAWKVFIYGATDAVNAQACANVRARFPRLTVAGQHGYSQGPAEEDAVIAKLRDEQFQLLIVARPSPDKELFLERCCKHAGVVGLAAGGYADVLAGLTRRAPQFVQDAGMEWLFRIVQEPGRLWKRVGWANARFAGAVLWNSLRVDPGRPWWGSRAIHLALILLAVTAGYVGAINAPYHFDDPEYIQHNPTIRSFKALSSITVLAHRKLWWLSNVICYKLSELFGNHQTDNPDVRVFRWWNVGCHFIAALALMGLVRRCMRAAGYVPEGSPGRGTPYDIAAFAAGAIFAAHPLCTESVTYISGRDNGQGGMFYLLGLYFAAVFFSRLSALGTSPLPKAKAAVWPGWVWPMVWMMIFGGFSVITKENHLTFPAAVVLVYLFFFRKSVRQTVSMGLLIGLLISIAILALAATGRRDGYLGPAAQAIVVIVTVCAFLGRRPESTSARSTFLQRRLNVGQALLFCIIGLGIACIAAFPYAYERVMAALHNAEQSNYVRSLCTQVYAVPSMLLKTIVPYGLNIDHDYPSIADPHDPRVLHGALILGALTLFGLIGLWRSWLGGFGVLLALLTIAPSNSVIERGDIVSERNFYLVAAGGACVIAWLVGVIFTFAARIAGGIYVSARHRGLGEPPAGTPVPLPVLHEAGLWAATLTCCIAGPLTSFTILRNQEWSEPLRLWQSAHAGSPNKLRVLYNLGVTNAAMGMKQPNGAEQYFDEAELCFMNAIRVGEDKVEKNLFRQDEAVEIKCFHLSYINLANLYILRYTRSIKAGEPIDWAPINRIEDLFKKGLERTTYDPDLALAYAQFEHDLGRYYQAVPTLQKSLALHTWAEQLFYPLGVALFETGDNAESIRCLTQATQIHERHTLGVEWDLPDDNRSDMFAFLGAAQYVGRDTAGATASFEKALSLDPHGVLLLLQISQRITNPTLHPVEVNPPDPFIQALTKVRRDLLIVLRDCTDRALQHDKEEKNIKRNKTLLENLRACLDAEIKRRAAVQAKRVEMGFKDDPDEIPGTKP